MPGRRRSIRERAQNAPGEIVAGPDVTYHAQRAGVFTRLVMSERVSELEAEQLMARWERESLASGREPGSPGFWDDAWRWIDGQRNPPTTDMDAEGADGQVYGG